MLWEEYLAKEISLNCSLSTSAVPTSALLACTGGPHVPVNPHKQRLLVAAHKEVKAMAKAKAKGKAKPNPRAGSKAKEAGQTQEEKIKNEPCTAPPEKKANTKSKEEVSPSPSNQRDTEPAECTTGGQGKKHADTAYNVEKKKFMARLLDPFFGPTVCFMR